MIRHEDCEDRCALKEHKGYHICSLSGRCELSTDAPPARGHSPTPSSFPQDGAVHQEGNNVNPDGSAKENP